MSSIQSNIPSTPKPLPQTPVKLAGGAPPQASSLSNGNSTKALNQAQKNAVIMKKSDLTNPSGVISTGNKSGGNEISRLSTSRIESGLISTVYGGLREACSDFFSKIKEEAGNISILQTLSKGSKEAFQSIKSNIAEAFQGVNASIDRGSAAATKKMGSLVTFFSSMIKSTKEWAMQPRIQPAAGDETTNNRSLQGRGAYKTIEKEFKDNKGVAFGSETVVRTDTLTQRINSLEIKIKVLEGRIANNSNNPARLSSDTRELKACKLDLENCRKSDTWAGSNDTRDVLVGGSFMGNRDKMIPAVPNHRVQTVKSGDVSESFQRFGALWDARDGLTNLKELKDLSVDYEKCKNGTQEQKDALNSKIDSQVYKLLNLEKKHTSPDQQALIKECLGKITSFRPESKITDAQRKEIVDNRQRFLREQTLEPIKLQLRDQASKLMTGNDGTKTLPMMHLGLLNSEARVDFQESGWAHIESNQILDMASIFSELDGCTINIREEPGSYFDEVIDEEGNAKTVLYLSKKEVGWTGEVPSEIKLETCFMNVSVQGHTTNDGIQEKINEESIVKLEGWIGKSEIPSDEKVELREKINGIKVRLGTDKESSFQLATDIAMVAKKFTAISEGCLSCKDRGGTVAEMIAVSIIEETQMANAKTDLEKKGIGMAINKFNNEILDKDSPCTKVVNDCTGVEVAKVDYTILKKMDPIIRCKKLGELVFAAATGGLNVTAAPPVATAETKVDAS